MMSDSCWRKHLVAISDTPESPEDIKEYLEFSLRRKYLPPCICSSAAETGWKVAAGKGDQEVRSDYLFHRWSPGIRSPGSFVIRVPERAEHVWEMTHPLRKSRLDAWRQALLKESIAKVQEHFRDYNVSDTLLGDLFKDNYTSDLQSSRIIGCTTTAAAKYTKLIRQAKPDIVLPWKRLERFLESHILTSLTPSVKQLILIGDHKQLRPKVSNYDLTVEKGAGFDLNRSLFEETGLAGSSVHYIAEAISDGVRDISHSAEADLSWSHRWAEDDGPPVRPRPAGSSRLSEPQHAGGRWKRTRREAGPGGEIQ